MFEDRLKDLRKKKGVTQVKVAESIYVSRSLIAKFETGAAYPDRETLEKLALYFEVPVSELIDQDETTLVAMESKDISERIHFVALLFILVLSTIYSIFVLFRYLEGSGTFIRFRQDRITPIASISLRVFSPGRTSTAIRLA